MKKSILLIISLVQISYGNTNYDYLNSLATPQSNWQPEITNLESSLAPLPNINLQGFYTEFGADGVVRIFEGLGAERYYPRWGEDLHRMLQTIATQEKLPFTQFTMNPQLTKISFINSLTNLRYEVTIGNERDQFSNAFSSYEVIMYVGHSRYGRGPAFQNMTNYFRMGNVFETIEVDTRNKYFLSEEMQLTETYPSISINLNNQDYFYQYRGQKVESSHLPVDSYTKNIPGLSVDFDNASFMEGRQIFWIHSCSNVNYFKDPIRSAFPDSKHKFVFGTSADSYGAVQSSAVFIASLAKQLSNSSMVVTELNKTDCKCFTTY